MLGCRSYSGNNPDAYDQFAELALSLPITVKPVFSRALYFANFASLASSRK